VRHGLTSIGASDWRRCGAKTSCPQGFARAGRSYSCPVRSASPPGTAVADPDVAATVRLLHRRQSWGRAAVIGFLAFVLTAGAYSSAASQGTPPPAWFLAIIIALAALTVVGIVAATADTVLLRRRSPQVRAQALPLAAQRPSRPHARHYPPRHRISWVLRQVGMLLFLAVAVVSGPAVVDGVAYLAGAGKTVTFDPLSYQTNCYRGGCQTSTVGILETGGAGTSATWPRVVPLGTPFQVREPVWRWGLGVTLIDSNGSAVTAIVVSLLIEGTAGLILFHLARLALNWRRHRQQLFA
jgi:hypothetical protein